RRARLLLPLRVAVSNGRLCGMAVTIVGLGGSLRVSSLSRTALAVALDGAAAAGASTELLDLRQLELPMFNPEQEADAPPVVRTMLETCYQADGMLWSSP